MIIVNIRGASGSGKSTVARTLLQYPHLGWREDVGLPLSLQEAGKRASRPEIRGYLSDHARVAIVGRYNREVGGGCDAIRTHDEAEARVRAYAADGYHVLFEGMILSGLFARWSYLCADLVRDGHQYIWAYLDTPLPVCLARVQGRRAEAGNEKPVNEANLIERIRRTRITRRDAMGCGYDVRDLDHERAVLTVGLWLGVHP